MKQLLGIIKQSRGWLLIYFLLLSLYAWFSYGLTAPNLILINQPWFSQFQFWMWDHFYNNRPFLTATYIGIIILIFLAYLILMSRLRSLKIKRSQKILVLILLSLPLVFSYNALSLDVFNYIFNARMIIKYQVDPHVTAAINFNDDPWLRFMHNIHTTAPYGYGWTLFSLPVYLLGMGKFLITWLNFRLLSLLSLILTAVCLCWLKKTVSNSKLSLSDWALVVFNPLLLVEIISNSHNDLWMMLPALTSFGLIFTAAQHKKNNKFWTSLGLSLLLLSLSVSIKLASIVLVPIWLLLTFNLFCPRFKQKQLRILIDHWPLLASIAMFLPLLTNRSQQFHPWYLTWSLVWLPLIHNKIWKKLLITFSLSSLLRYTPFLLANDYSQDVLLKQKIITWSAPLLLGIYYLTETGYRTVKNCFGPRV
jgi:hypothetical protein